MAGHVIFCDNSECNLMGLIINVCDVSDTEKIKNEFFNLKDNAHGDLGDNVTKNDFCPRCRRLGKILTHGDLLSQHGSTVNDLINIALRIGDGNGVHQKRLMLPTHNQAMMIMPEVL